ncbi:MAG: protein kinase, partial [Singulisphaera sp.]
MSEDPDVLGRWRAPRLDDFAVNLAKSGLVDPLVVSRALADLDPEPATDASIRLARRLLQAGALTSYQARKVLGGATQGFVLGGYRILRPIGEGGMGKVFLAVHETDGRRVAIKVLPPKKALGDEQALNRFRREMDLSRRVQHPNLARTLEVGSEGDIHFMVWSTSRARASTSSSSVGAAGLYASPTPHDTSSRCSTASAPRTPAGSSTATSSPRTSWSRPRAARSSSTSAWPAPRARPACSRSPTSSSARSTTPAPSSSATP